MIAPITVFIVKVTLNWVKTYKYKRQIKLEIQKLNQRTLWLSYKYHDQFLLILSQ